MRAGLLCVDCHRNGLDHMIVRGYAGEPAAKADPAVETLTCRGCHLGSGPLMGERDPAAGRLGAPRPEHRGIPLLHFEKLTCTACHSGPWPGGAVQRSQTAMNHGLGVPTRERTEQDPPTMVEPVFARNERGAIGPHRMLWPAYWGVMDGDKAENDPSADEPSRTIRPLPIDVVQRAAAKVFGRSKPKHAPAGPLTDEEIVVMFMQFTAARKGGAGEVVYVRDGCILRVDPEDAQRLAVVDNANAEAARPYLWPIAHDVRPASQSLGIRGCTDCHSTNAPIYFGGLAAVDEPDATGRPFERMHELRDERMPVVRNWAMLFAGRGAFKILGVICTAILAVVLTRHGLAGLGKAKTRE
jgi:hypothetical protein